MLDPELEQAFKESLLKDSKEVRTVKNYLYEIQYFHQFLRKVKDRELQQLQEDDLISYRDFLQEEGYSVATINKSMSIINTFLKWANSKALLKTPGEMRLRIIEDSHHDKKANWITELEETELLYLVEKERNEKKRWRNLTLISFMLHLGLRLEEVSLMKIHDVDEQLQVLTIPDYRELPIPLPSITTSYLSKWFLHREKMKETLRSSPSIFITERSLTMQPRSIQFVIEGYSKKLGFPVTPQMLRHTYCRRLVENGVPLQEVKKLAGHKSIQTTYKYVT